MNNKEALLKELADKLKDEEMILLEILYVLDGKKPGVFLNLKKKQLKKIKNLIINLGMKVSEKFDGYVTYKQELFNEWDESKDEPLPKDEKFIDKSMRLLGYPKCCVKRFYRTNKLGIPKAVLIDDFYTYYLINKFKPEEVKEYIKNSIYLEEYFTCSISCEESKKRANSFKEIFNKYKKLFPSDWKKKRIEYLNESFKWRLGNNLLDDLNKEWYEKQFKNPENLMSNIEKGKINELLKLEDDYKIYIQELFNNKELVKQKVESFIKNF